MPANDPTTIMLSGLEWDRAREAVGSGVITPGMLLLQNTDTDVVVPHSAAGGFSQKIFARRANAGSGVGQGIDTNYASGDTVRFGYARTGDQVNAILIGGTTSLAANAEVVSDGAGGVKVRVAEDYDLVIGKTLAAATDPTTGFVRVPIEVY